MTDLDKLELKNMILETRKEFNRKIDILMPAEFSLSFLSQRTGWSRNGLKRKLKAEYEEGVDFYLKNSKTTMTKKVALEMIAMCPVKEPGSRLRSIEREDLQCAS